MYIAWGLAIRPKTSFTKIDALKEIIRAWGLNPEELLTKQALATPHRTVTTTQETEQQQIQELSNILKNIMKNEIQPTQN